MDFNNAKTYQMLNTITNDVYVGSTCSSLAKRMYDHRRMALSKPHWRVYQKFAELGHNNFYIELIESYPCNCRDELRAREGHYIRERGTLNKKIAGRTDAEYQADNRENKNEKQKEYAKQHKEERSEYHKKWYAENRNAILANIKTQTTCECGKTYTIHHKARHDKSEYHKKTL